MQTLNIFPTLIGLSECPLHSDFRRDLLEYSFDHMVDGGSSDREGACRYVHKDVRLKRFFTHISTETAKYLSQLHISHRDFDINIIKSWYNIVDKENANPSHGHPDAHYSFVYYVNVPENFQKEINFHAKNPNEPYEGLFRWAAKDWDRFNCHTMSYIPTEGQMFIWPSNLLHSTGSGEHNPSSEKIVNAEQLNHCRVSIAGDILLTHRDPNFPTYVGIPPVSHWRSFI